LSSLAKLYFNIPVLFQHILVSVQSLTYMIYISCFTESCPSFSEHVKRLIGVM